MSTTRIITNYGNVLLEFAIGMLVQKWQPYYILEEVIAIHSKCFERESSSRRNHFTIWFLCTVYYHESFINIPLEKTIQNLSKKVLTDKIRGRPCGGLASV